MLIGMSKYMEKLLIILPLLLSFPLAIYLASYIGRRRTVPGAWPLVVLVLTAAIWTTAYAMELVSEDLATKLFWAKVQYIGIVTVAPAWFLFVIQYTARQSWLTRSPRNRILLAIIPIITLVLVWTNQAHGLIWSRISLEPTAVFTMLELDHGAWFWVFWVYAYSLLLIGSIWFASLLLQSSHLFRWQVSVALLGMLVPWIANLLYVTNLTPANLDLTPFAFIIAGLAFAWSLFRFHLLDLVPIARRVVVDGLRDSIVVLDLQNRIVDLNPAIQELAGKPASEMIGRPVDQILGPHADLINQSHDLNPIQTEIMMKTADVEYCFELRVSPLLSQRKAVIGQLVVLHDITDRKRAEEELRQARDGLELVVTERTADLEEANRKLREELARRKAAEDRYLSLFEEAPVMYVITRSQDETAIIVDCNRLFLDTLGYQRDEVLDRPLADFYTPSSRAALDQSYLRTVGDELILEERQLLTHQGRVVETLLQARSELDPDGNTLGVRSMYLDITQRKQAERRFEGLLESAPDAVIIVNDEGSIVLVNAQTEQMFGYAREQLLDENLEILLPARFHDRHLASQVDYFSKSQMRSMGPDLELWGRRKDGSEFPVEISLNPQEMEEGLLVFASIRDISNRKKSEVALRESEQTYRALFENANDAIFRMSLDGLHLQVNRKAAELLGYQQDELVGMTYHDIVDPRETQDAEGKFKALLAGQTLPSYERSFRTKEGDVLPVEINVTLVQDVEGDPKFILSIVRDIRERKLAEEALRESEAKFRSIFESSPLGKHHYQLEPEGRLVFMEANPAADEILGVDHNKLVGSTIEEAFPEISATEVLEQFRRLAESGGTWSTDQLLYQGDEISGVFEVHGFQTSPGRMVAAFIDITNRKRAEETILRLAKQRQRLLQVSQSMLSTLALDEVMDQILVTLQDILSYDLCSIYMLDQEAGLLRPSKIAGHEYVSDSLGEWPIQLGQGIAGEVAQSGQGEMVNDAHLDPRSLYPDGAEIEREHLISIPVRVQEETLGVFNVGRIQASPFTEEEFELVQLFTAQAAIAIHNAQLYSELEQQREQLRTLTRRLVNAQEEERKDLARELHDRVGQSLTAIDFNLNLISSQLPEDSPASEQIRLQVDASLALLTQTAELIRDVMANLRPPVLDDYGLMAALDWFGNQFVTPRGIIFTMDGREPAPRLAPPVEVVFFRIAQEAISNVIRHAQATTLTIQLESDRDQDIVRMIIADDGAGFVPENRAGPSDRQSWGLIGMAERAEAVGAQYRIESIPGQGTQVIVEITR